MAANYVRALGASDVLPGQVKVITVSGCRLAVCNVDGEFFAVDDLCTHDNGPLGEGEILDHQIECPRHGARFDVRTGKPACLPAVLPIKTYPTEIRGSDVFIAVPPK